MGYINFEQVEGKHPTMPIKDRSLLWFLIRDARGYYNLTKQANKSSFNKRNSNVICYLASDRKRLPTFKHVFNQYQPIMTVNEETEIYNSSYYNKGGSIKQCPFLLACKKKNYEAAEVILQRMSLKPEIGMIMTNIDCICDNKDILLRLLKAMVCDVDTAEKCLKDMVERGRSTYFYAEGMKGEQYYGDSEGEGDEDDPNVNKYS